MSERRLAVNAFERRALRRIRDVGSARQLVRQRTHVAAALYVVLSTQGHEAGAVASDVAGQQGQVDQREDVVDRVVMLGDAQRPAELGSPGTRIGVSQRRGWRRPERR